MSVATLPARMTTEELLALPDDGIDRWLIDGRLREDPIVRHRLQSRIIIRTHYVLGSWLEHQPPPRGSIRNGKASVRLRRDPDWTVGIDVVYISAELAAQQPSDTTLIDGVPVLAVEILSPTDTQEIIYQKIDRYLQAGVALVWVINPSFRTVTVYRPNAEPEMLNVSQELTAEPHLPGFRVAVAQLFN
jgi:Uma2 family endonuclease